MNSNFAKDTLEGLTAKEKFLHSKYFYDDNGSRIFQDIMQMPEYYLTDSEFEILSLQAKQIVDALNFNQPYNIVELGAGDGFKTFKLLEYLVHNNIEFHYVPIDISQEAIDLLTAKLKEKLPSLSIYSRVGDYFEILKKENTQTKTPSLLLFLGSNIGNYDDVKARELLNIFNNNMKAGDKLLIGFDLKKNPVIIRNAYDDKHGITKKFNLNLLVRINKTLNADFEIDNFDFYSYYNPKNGEVKSYLVSLKEQKIQLGKLDVIIKFKQNELIWTELSKKYTQKGVENFAKNANFTVNQHFLDCKQYFVDSLWEK